METMTSKYESGTDVENGAARAPQHPSPLNSEAIYDWLTGYAFARRYAREKTVANVGWKEIRYGSRLLADMAQSVVGLTNSSEAVEQASTALPAPNVSYQKVTT